jgi:hypothetical protein
LNPAAGSFCALALPQRFNRAHRSPAANAHAAHVYEIDFLRQRRRQYGLIAREVREKSCVRNISKNWIENHDKRTGSAHQSPGTA